MINLSPMEEFYLKEILRDKQVKEIAKENRVNPDSISICINRLKKRTQLSKSQLFDAIIQKNYNVMYRGKPCKRYEEIFNETKETSMIKLTPKQSLYLKEFLKGKTAQDIAAELGIYPNTYVVTISYICKKLGMTRAEILEKYLTKEIEFKFTDTPEMKQEYKIENDKRYADRIEQIKAMRRLGFTDKEILEELRHE